MEVRPPDIETWCNNIHTDTGYSAKTRTDNRHTIRVRSEIEYPAGSRPDTDYDTRPDIRCIPTHRIVTNIKNIADIAYDYLSYFLIKKKTLLNAEDYS